MQLLTNRLPSSLTPTTAGNANRRHAARPVLESLEDRCLLSAVAPHAAVPAVVLGSTYNGTLHFPRQHAHAASSGAATLTLNPESSTGSVTGSLAGPTVGTVAVSGQLTGHRLTLTFTGDSSGSATLLVLLRGRRLIGNLDDQSAGLRARVLVNEPKAAGSTSGGTGSTAAGGGTGGTHSVRGALPGTGPGGATTTATTGTGATTGGPGTAATGTGTAGTGIQTTTGALPGTGSGAFTTGGALGTNGTGINATGTGSTGSSGTFLTTISSGTASTGFGTTGVGTTTSGTGGYLTTGSGLGMLGELGTY